MQQTSAQLRGLQPPCHALTYAYAKDSYHLHMLLCDKENALSFTSFANEGDFI